MPRLAVSSRAVPATWKSSRSNFRRNCSASGAPLSIVGVRNGDRLRRPAGSAEPLSLQLSALGGSGRRWWFIDGQPVAETRVDAPLRQRFSRVGRYQLSVLDESGQTAAVSFTLQD